MTLKEKGIGDGVDQNNGVSDGEKRTNEITLIPKGPRSL